MTDALNALRRADFSKFADARSVWRNTDYDVAEFHQDIVDRIEQRFASLHADENAANPAGEVIVGPAGSGKTHVLGALRRRVVKDGGWFVFLDMSDVNDFWPTVADGFITSLLTDPGTGEMQSTRLSRQLSERLSQHGLSDASATEPADGDPAAWKRHLDQVERALVRLDRGNALSYAPVLRALKLLQSDDLDLSAYGSLWLNGQALEPEVANNLGFRGRQLELREVVRGLSWLMSLAGPTMVALDQLDAIVSQYGALASASKVDRGKQAGARAIVEGLGNGMMSLTKAYTQRSLIVVGCLEQTWEALGQIVLTSVTDSFSTPSAISTVPNADYRRRLVEKRLAIANEATGFAPPYPSYPFKPSAFDGVAMVRPRQVLAWCAEHQQRCLQAGRAVELTAFGDGIEPIIKGRHEKLDKLFADLRAKQPMASLLSSDNEETGLADALRAGLRCLTDEMPSDPNIDRVVDEDFAGKRPSLHARLRFVHRAEGDREDHASFRVIYDKQGIAYTARVRAADTASGIDPDLDFRSLRIAHSEPLPETPKAKEVTEECRRKGGSFMPPSDDEWRTLFALREMERQNPDGFKAWLHERRPASGLALFEGIGPARPATPQSQRPDEPEPLERPSKSDMTAVQGDVLLGRAEADGAPVAVPLAVLAKHTIILAGSGSGKTVLLRRLIEEAALMGAPALVLDSNNDLALLGNAWPTPPDVWSDEDRAKATRYLGQTEVVVWTPGRKAGNPLSFAPIPDFAALRDDPDALDQAILVTQGTLEGLLGLTDNKADTQKKGVLRAALQHYAGEAGAAPVDPLGNFIALLREPPGQVEAVNSKAKRLTTELADLLSAKRISDPTLAASGAPLDPAELFRGADGKTRISVINFIGLPNLAQQQSFVGQLTTALFTWVKNNPADGTTPLRLLALDEAHQFAPSVRNAPSKQGLLLLTRQARKYGLGLMFATQMPKDLDHGIVGNCTTQFYGKASSPAAIEVIRDAVAQRGGNAPDISRLGPGRFYASSEGLATPVKLSTPLCLSHHPSPPPGEEAILEIAAQYRPAERPIEAAPKVATKSKPAAKAEPKKPKQPEPLGWALWRRRS